MKWLSRNLKAEGISALKDIGGKEIPYSYYTKRETLYFLCCNVFWPAGTYVYVD